MQGSKPGAKNASHFLNALQIPSIICRWRDSVLTLSHVFACRPDCAKSAGIKTRGGEKQRCCFSLRPSNLFLHLYFQKRRLGAPFLKVQMERFELSSFRRRILSPLCMPFHHICISTIIHPGAGQVNMRKGKGFALTTNRFGSTCFLPPERPCFYGRGTILERVGNPHEGGGGCTLNCFLPTISF